jgi:hypothetical protein
MEASFYPPRHIFNNNSYDDNLNLQHEALKRIVNIYENMSNFSIDQQEDITTIEKILIKRKRRTKKDLNDKKA